MIAAVILALAVFGHADCTNSRDERSAIDATPTQIWLQIVTVAHTRQADIDTMIAAAAAIWAPYNVIVSPVLSRERPGIESGQWITLILRSQPANQIDGRTPRGPVALASLTFIERSPGNNALSHDLARFRLLPEQAAALHR